MQASASSPVFRKGIRHPLASRNGHPAAGLTTFPRKRRLWVVTSQRSTRKGRLKWACGADVVFRDWGWERRPEAAAASVPRSLMSTAALWDTWKERKGQRQHQGTSFKGTVAPCVALGGRRQNHPIQALPTEATPAFISFPSLPHFLHLPRFLGFTLTMLFTLGRGDRWPEEGCGLRRMYQAQQKTMTFRSSSQVPGPTCHFLLEAVLALSKPQFSHL